MLIPFGVLSAAGAGGEPLIPDYELIATAFGTGSSTTVEFTSIPADYKHLQIRYTGKSMSPSGGAENLRIRFNNITTNSYASHAIEAFGTSVITNTSTSLSYIELLRGLSYSGTANAFAAGFIDILDYASASKNTTIRSLNGKTDTAEMMINSGALFNTAAVNRVTLFGLGNFNSGSRFSLYGIRG